MTTATARAIVRRLQQATDGAARASLQDAIILGGFDPWRLPPDDPQTDADRAASDALADAVPLEGECS